MTDFLLIMIFAALLVLMSNTKRIYDRNAKGKRDDTDPKNGKSGLIILTDYKTGKQYLSTPLGGITPRLEEKENA